MDMDVIVSQLDLTMSLITLLVFLLSYLLLYRRDRGYALPPGPPVFPFIGTAYVKPTMRGLIQIRERYGDATTVYLGPMRGVVLNSYAMVKEATVTQASVFSDRGNHASFCISAINPRFKGVINSDYHDTLRHNRNHSLTILRNLGVGRSCMEDKILEEAQDLCQHFAEQNSRPFDPWNDITCSVLNVIFHVCLNKRLQRTDPDLKQVLKYTDDVIKAGNHQPFIDAFNSLRFVPPLSITYSKLLVGDKGMADYMWNCAETLINQFELGKDTNFIDCWLNDSRDKDTQEPSFDEENLKYILRDFLLAGSETTTTSIKWTLLFLANRPQLQEKIYDQINSVIGSSRQVRLSDREDLPLVEALIWEIQRYNTIVPVGLPHFCTNGAKLGKYDIPPQTFVVTNLHAIHMNPDVFDNPREFIPERFIDRHGKFCKHSHVIPFGIGKRSCLGELLARQELFLFTTSLLQRFRFLPPEGVRSLDERGILGFTYGPKVFKLRAVPR